MNRISSRDFSTLSDLAEIKTNSPQADFWIIQKGSEDKVGQPAKEFKPQYIGIKVIRTDVVLPDYLYYALMNIHAQGYWRQLSMGSLALKHIRIQDVKNLKLG